MLEYREPDAVVSPRSEPAFFAPSDAAVRRLCREIAAADECAGPTASGRARSRVLLRFRTRSPIPFRNSSPYQNSISRSGERELRVTVISSAARTAFDRAVDVLLESPGGARSNPQLSAHYDRLIERISGHELTALAQADGFAEKAPEPASIDDLLIDCDLRAADADPGDRTDGRRRSSGRRSRHRDPAECPRAGLRRAVYRPAEGISRRRTRAAGRATSR